jgi:hypothetical protein
MTERGWGWPASKIRQAQLVEWLVSEVADKDSVAGWDISVESFYEAQLPDQSDHAVYETAIDDLKTLRRASLVEFQQSTGGLRAVHVQATQRARDQAEQWRDIRANMRLRRAACRDALVDWLYGQDAVTDMPPFPVVDQMLADRRHGLWFAAPFTVDDLDEASAWLERHGLINGPKIDQRSGPIHAYLTDAGASCAADFDCRTDAYTDAQRRAPHSGPIVNIHGGNSGPLQVAGDDAHQVQNIGANADDLRLLTAGIAEIVRTFVPDVAEDSHKQEDAALAAITAVSVDEPALRRFRDWAVTTMQTGAGNAVVAAISSSTTFLLIEAGRLAAHMV